MSNIKILSASKKRAFENVPLLSKDARKGYFLIDPETRRILSTFKSDENKVCFLIQQAYFQAKGRFFNINKCKAIDKRFAEKAIGLKSSINLNNYASQTASNHKKLILQKYKWQAFQSCHKEELYEHAKIHVDKRYSKEAVFFTLLNYCWLHRIEIPSYDIFSIIVSDSFYKYEKELIQKFSNCLTEQQGKILENFLTKNEKQYTLRDLKKIDQGDTQTLLNRNASLLSLYRDAFLNLKPILDSLSLSKDAIIYFSDWIYKSNISQIKQLKDENKRYLYLLAFISDQFFKRQDFASDAIQKVLRSKVNKAKGYERKRRQEQEVETIEANKSVMNSAKDSKQVLKLVLEISGNSTLEYAERNERVVQLVRSFFEAENPDLGQHIEKVERSIFKVSINEDFYKHLFSSYISIQRSLGPLIKEMIFDEGSTNSDLLKAIKAYKNDNIDLNDSDTTDFLKKNELGLIKSEDKTPAVSKFKILLFIHVSQALKGQGITMDFSYRYKHTSHYQISNEEWNKKRNSILKATSLDRFSDGKEILSSIGQKVSAAFSKTNKKIKKNENQFFIQKNDGSWRIKDSDADYDVSKYIPTLLSNNSTIMLQDMVSEIDNHTKFSESFKHSSLRDANNQIDVRLLYATIMSLGTNMGHTAMSKSSRIFTEKALRDTENHWLSNKNIKIANDLIIKTIQSLPLPTVFNDQFGRLHTSSDGKKVVVAVNSLLANYSYKYYGKEQGISVNSFLDEKQSFFHVNVLTASDREAPYMMDGIVSSKSCFESESLSHHMHSTDTHGYTEAIFAGLHFLDVSFAPRIKNIHEQTIYAYESKTTQKRSSDPVTGNRQINKKLILDNWDDILRLMASIKLEYCSASHIFKMLSMSEKDSQLYKAVKEFGRLIKTNFILNYIDDEDLRRSIQKQLNRVELGQKLTDAVFFGRNGKLMVGLKDEIQKVMGCNTLLRNVIILWNYLFLSDYYYSLDNDEVKKSVLDSIASGSVISWRHLNTLGIYEFNKDVRSSFKATLTQMKNIDVIT